MTDTRTPAAPTDQPPSTDATRFAGLELPPVIDTGETDFVTEFYEPLLERTRVYKRGVGYFTSGWLAQNAAGVTRLATVGGTAKLITSPTLSAADWDALRTGTDARRNEILAAALTEQVTDLEASLETDTRNALAWLIADGIIEIRFALPTAELSGEFHDKWAVFESFSGEKVAIHGSQNDSKQGFKNYESYDIFTDWVNHWDAERVARHENRFDRLWRNENPNVDTVRLPTAIKDDLISLRTTSMPPYEPPTPDGGIELREYQQAAVDAWFANGSRGLFRMATGTGKTYTALGAMDKLVSHQEGPLLIVVSVPYTHLASQWEDSLQDWGYGRTKRVYGSANRDWKSDLASRIDDLSIGIRDVELCITTHTTLSHEFFQRQINTAACEVLLIADEVHGLGSEDRRNGLVTGYEYRLGLSATPEREYDETGTEYLLEYFGGIVYEYSLAEAIPEYLVPYEYYPVIVELTEEELDTYAGISRRLASEFSKEHPDEELLERLMLNRARLVKSADNKLASLRSILSELPEKDHLLVYTNPQQFDDVQHVLNSKGVIQHQFTAEEDQAERARLLDGFANGEYDALVAMKCLDEGVDVPSTKRAVLMSNSNNPMQFIQRRGRVLRRADEYGKDTAEIYDLIVVPSLNPERKLVQSEKRLLEKELRRFNQFAELARNEIQAKNRIEPIRTQYEL